MMRRDDRGVVAGGGSRRSYLDGGLSRGVGARHHGAEQGH